MFDKILQWQQSGLTQKAYSEQGSIAYYFFITIGSQKFIKLQVTPNYVSTQMELIYPDGKRVTKFAT